MFDLLVPRLLGNKDRTRSLMDNLLCSVTIQAAIGLVLVASSSIRAAPTMSAAHASLSSSVAIVTLTGPLTHDPQAQAMPLVYCGGIKIRVILPVW